MNNLILSTEKINDFQQCPLLYYYKHILRQTPNKKKEWLETGDLIHFLLKIYYQSIIEKVTIPLEAIIDIGRNHAALTLDIKSEEVEGVIKDFRMYYNYYAHNETWQIDAAEEPFAKVLWESDNIRIVITGKIDLRVTTMNGKGPRALVDHKYESRFEQKPNRENQPLCYVWAYEIDDWIYNRIGKQPSYTPEKRLVRPYFNYNKFQIEDWKDSTIETALNIYRCLERNKFPMQISGCHGNYKCDFYDVCDTTPDNRAYKLETMFKIRKSGNLMERD